MFTFAKFSAIIPATVTIVLALGGATEEIGSFLFFCRIAKGGQGKYCFMSLPPMVSLSNFANVNDPQVAADL